MKNLLYKLKIKLTQYLLKAIDIAYHKHTMRYYMLFIIAVGILVEFFIDILSTPVVLSVILMLIIMLAAHQLLYYIGEDDEELE